MDKTYTKYNTKINKKYYIWQLINSIVSTIILICMLAIIIYPLISEDQSSIHAEDICKLNNQTNISWTFTNIENIRHVTRYLSDSECSNNNSTIIANHDTTRQLISEIFKHLEKYLNFNLYYSNNPNGIIKIDVGKYNSSKVTNDLSIAIDTCGCCKDGASLYLYILTKLSNLAIFINNNCLT
ncbi:hypothetical protein [Alphaentomopoxvirus acuprea]|uniref:Uncharacterized protein n=1 Tax=Alphaentomopoxvirus acuprea TaxID=62099 RepID=W6JIL6_9POXV|nr:hypothetical protein BA82_gp022 [Anomala cuprea entomopoxvirus]YP_009001715.1 hypothetical protein BA82_gp242 [Anomala cuprea entomopoxvirus]BAO49382.1 hypothetical protein [Anomala cuprea entomopoxvirus]BAO49602.1 hypothetical protein [Anomala cuprea entomopoxvirus]